MDQKESCIGFYGKVMTHGDFVSRRLSPAFVRRWDGWLQGGLQCSRERLGTQWLETYLCSPIWRFALAAGVCGEQAWSGVMMPSVDRVGRYFPLTIAVGGQDVPLLERLQQDAGWYERLEDLALSSLAEGFSLMAFDAALSALNPPLRAAQPQGVTLQSCVATERWLALPDLQHSDLSGLEGRALFWTDGSPRMLPSLLVCPGLPSPDTFADMLDGGGDRSHAPAW